LNVDPADVIARPTIDELFTRPAWQADALCREHPDVTFFPERGQASAPAKAICAPCLVRADCLQYGMTQPCGIWGGTSDRERRARRAKRGQIVVGSSHAA